MVRGSLDWGVQGGERMDPGLSIAESLSCALGAATTLLSG